MSYLVLARKHRPQTFDDVIGQLHVTDLLKKAVESGRIAHAYLLCGPRGVGKTSCARILAMCLNCQKGPTTKPCGECSSCTEIAKGSSFDVLEIDGASNRGIDEIRTLRENVKFAPSYGRYKIYIVDEVHMLTMEAFNALLKTLEEPPAHVKFIFATTTPNKVPDTILSRCQRFDFKRIPLSTTVELLNDVCKKEKLSIEQDALYAIAKASQGGLRDALSILDQISALNDREIKADDVFGMLGIVETSLLFELSAYIADKNCAAALQVLDKIIEKGKDVKQLARDVTDHFRNLMVVKVGGKTMGKLIDYPTATKDMLLEQSSKMTLKQILTAIDELIGAQETARITESIRMSLEVAIAKITYSEEALINSAAVKNTAPSVTTQPVPMKPAAIAPFAQNPKPLDRAQPKATVRNERGEIHVSPVSMNPIQENDPPDEGVELLSTAEVVSFDLESLRKAWDALTYAVSREKMSTATYLQEGIPHEIKGNKLMIAFPASAKFHKEALEEKSTLAVVENVFSRQLRARVQVGFIIVSDQQVASPLQEDDAVKSALNVFRGKVTNRWHNE
jgi:DNA polymerase-3 subunit gamma/tau